MYYPLTSSIYNGLLALYRSNERTINTIQYNTVGLLRRQHTNHRWVWIIFSTTVTNSYLLAKNVNCNKMKPQCSPLLH